ncbi:BMP family ABC transporter substrate-binding protein [Anoxynatronum buryatiense]|uniref:Nucleoside-binding protein n=1 Tax=Anoxynatronum buryatiense TaxID=489973 RepID=A0AA46AJH0_9CLOT|nr:BMP family ABC transporter substrate-binding protein [Anoxynatronum buryatiense]SMP61359.1 nucleoside-binding protein [Anoxynatronum buryatiense]
MKKKMALLLILIMTLSLAACGSPAPAPAPSEEPAGETEAAAEGVSDDGTFELALITDIGTIDDKSFNQGSWEGLRDYAVDNGISHKYYQPSEKSTDAYLSAIELAVRGGAKVIVTPGFLFEEPIFIAQDQYPDTHFILIDGVPHNEDYTEFRTEPNVVGVLYAEEQAGFLAGYAAVKDGSRSLGFMGGMAVPAVVRFGYGFVQGAEYAAEELGLAAGDVTINYHYTGGFDATPEVQTLAASWYQSGVDTIFACGGAVGNSVMAAAEQAGAKVVGVDIDQSGESETVITSAMKGLGASVYSTLEAFYAGSFPGGETIVMDASNDGVALPMATSRFESFSQADYDAIFGMLVNDSDGIASSMLKDNDVDSAGAIPTEIVTVTLVN